MPGVIKINPAVFEDKRDAVAVSWNEGLRLTMSDIGFEPKFAITPAQKKFFRGTAYASDESALRKTIIARIATHDTSVTPTPEQEAETVRLLDTVAEMLGSANPETKVVIAMRESVANGGARGKTREVPTEEPAEPTEEPAEPTEEVPPEPPVEAEAQAADLAGDTREDPARDAVVNQAIRAAFQAEDSGPNDVGDKGRAVGPLQLWPIRVREANRIVGKETWTVDDRTNTQLSRAMAKVFFEHHYDRGVKDPVALGGRWRNPNGNAPEWYLNKVRKGLK
jgi:hypothetical protein